MSWNKNLPAGTSQMQDSDDAIRANLSALETSLGASNIGVNTFIPIESARYASGVGTRLLVGTNETVSYDGLGFQPKTMIFFSSFGGTLGFSNGLKAGTFQSQVIFKNTAGVFQYSSGQVIYAGDGASWNQTADVSFGTNGFTLSWTKAGSPTTGTISFIYLAMR